jgi:hypothetical protein
MASINIHNNNTLNALILKPLLLEKFALLTGARDKHGHLLIQIPCDSQIDKLTYDNLQKVILYLALIQK